MLDWMRTRGWQLPHTVVAPYLTRSAVSDETAPTQSAAPGVRQLVFFGRLEERKGLAPFLEALNGLSPAAMNGIELVFLGRETALWPVDRVEDGISDRIKGELAALRFETNLDQPEALDLLARPGTLALMPSLVDNSPNVIYECLEYSIPFLASSAGGGAELVAAADRERAFFQPTAAGIRSALERVLTAADGLAPLRPSFDTADVLATWEQIIASNPVSPVRGDEIEGEGVSVIVIRDGEPEPDRCLAALAAQTHPPEQ